MASVSTSFLATSVALLIGATPGMAAEKSLPQATATPAPGQGDDSSTEVPATAFKDFSVLNPEVVQGVPVDEAEWRVQLYSDFVFTQEAKDTDAALPNTDRNKKFLSQLLPWELKHRCGGVYIGDLWVLTAAHCVHEVSPASLLTFWRVRVGATDLELSPGTSYRIERVIHNNKYVGFLNEKGSDIALIKMAPDTGTDLALSAAKLKAIRILGDTPGDLPVANNTDVEVSGWGTTQVRAHDAPPLTPANAVMHASQLLRKATVKKLPISVCMADENYKVLITRSRDKNKVGDPVICVGEGDPQADACQGDSGGPLTHKIGTQTVLVGLVSLGKGCGTGSPAIYTNVTYFLDWISAAKLEPARQVSRW